MQQVRLINKKKFQQLISSQYIWITLLREVCTQLCPFWYCCLMYTEPLFVNLLKSPGIDSQPGGIDSWAP